MRQVRFQEVHDCYFGMLRLAELAAPESPCVHEDGRDQIRLDDVLHERLVQVIKAASPGGLIVVLDQEVADFARKLLKELDLGRVLEVPEGEPKVNIVKVVDVEEDEWVEERLVGRHENDAGILVPAELLQVLDSLFVHVNTLEKMLCYFGADEEGRLAGSAVQTTSKSFQLTSHILSIKTGLIIHICHLIYLYITLLQSHELHKTFHVIDFYLKDL